MPSISSSATHTARTAKPLQPSFSAFWLWAGFILVALNLRLIFATLGPLLHQLTLSPSATLWVTALPVALLGVFSIPGVHLRRWLGEERALFLALLLLTVGCGLRWWGVPGLIAGSVLGSAGIGVMNVIMPVLARKRFGPERMGLVMGVYALMLGAGAVLGACGTLPLFEALSAQADGAGSVAKAAYQSLGLWALPALLALLVWLPQLAHKATPLAAQAHSSAAAPVRVYRHPKAWSITLFFGLQAFNLYVFLPWLPTMLMDRGSSQASAIWVFSASQLSLMLGSFVTPWLAARKPDQRLWIAITVLSCLAGTLGLLHAPLGSALLWALLLGFGQGAGPSLGAYFFVAKASTMEVAAQLAAMAQTVGFLIAAAGPLLIGAIYHYSGSWRWPGAILVAVLLLEWLVAWPAGRASKV